MNPLPASSPNINNPLHFAGKQRLLIADDEPINRNMHKKFVEKFNTEQTTDHFEIATAVDGQEALDKIEQAQQEGQPYSVLITDNAMPKKTGLELISALSKLPIKPFIAMISSDNVEAEARKKGANAFYTKPAKKDTIRDILKQYQGTLTCPIPASKPTLADLPHTTTPTKEIKTSLSTLNNPFESAFALETLRDSLNALIAERDENETGEEAAGEAGKNPSHDKPPAEPAPKRPGLVRRINRSPER